MNHRLSCTTDSPAAAAVDSSFDLTRHFAKYMDPHFLVPVFMFLKTRGVYAPDVADEYLLKLFRSTKYTAEAVAETFPGAPTTGLIAPAVLASEMRALYAACGPKVEEAAADGFATLEADDLRGSSAGLDGLLRLSKGLYQSGQYTLASAALKQYRKCCGSSAEGVAGAWGKLASDVMGGSFEEAHLTRTELGSALDRAQSAKHVTQAQRAWLLHWNLFVCFNRVGGMESLLEVCMLDSNRQVIQALCPWLVRYVAVAVVLTRRRHVLQPLLSLLREVSFRDPVVEFVELLLVHFDFEAAQAKLAECGAVFAADYFLGSHVSTPEFVNAAQLHMFQLYCRLHSTASLQFVSKMLGCDVAGAESWVVELIRAGQLKARINSLEGIVVVEPPQSRIHQAVAEKTKSTLSRASFVWNRLGFSGGQSKYNKY